MRLAVGAVCWVVLMLAIGSVAGFSGAGVEASALLSVGVSIALLGFIGFAARGSGAAMRSALLERMRLAGKTRIPGAGAVIALLVWFTVTERMAIALAVLLPGVVAWASTFLVLPLTDGEIARAKEDLVPRSVARMVGAVVVVYALVTMGVRYYALPVVVEAEGVDVRLVEIGELRVELGRGSSVAYARVPFQRVRRVMLTGAANLSGPRGRWVVWRGRDSVVFEGGRMAVR